MHDDSNANRCGLSSTFRTGEVLGLSSVTGNDPILILRGGESECFAYDTISFSDVFDLHVVDSDESVQM